jgi:hypothetical protein
MAKKILQIPIVGTIAIFSNGVANDPSCHEIRSLARKMVEHCLDLTIAKV